MTTTWHPCISEDVHHDQFWEALYCYLCTGFVTWLLTEQKGSPSDCKSQGSPSPAFLGWGHALDTTSDSNKHCTTSLYCGSQFTDSFSKPALRYTATTQLCILYMRENNTEKNTCMPMMTNFVCLFWSTALTLPTTTLTDQNHEELSSLLASTLKLKYKPRELWSCTLQLRKSTYRRAWQLWMITLLEYIVTLPKYNTCQSESIALVSDCESYEDVGCLLLQSAVCIEWIGW